MSDPRERGLYQVSIPRRLTKRIERFPTADFERVTGAILALADDPRPSGRKKLQGRNNEWRIRVGDYRIIYELEDEARTVTVTAVGHRRDVYRRG